MQKIQEIKKKKGVVYLAQGCLNTFFGECYNRLLNLERTVKNKECRSCFSFQSCFKGRCQFCIYHTGVSVCVCDSLNCECNLVFTEKIAIITSTFQLSCTLKIGNDILSTLIAIALIVLVNYCVYHVSRCVQNSLEIHDAQMRFLRFMFQIQ